MNTQDNPNKSSTLLLVGMLAVIALGVVGALIYNQQLHVYENRAIERGRTGTLRQQEVRMDNPGKGNEEMRSNGDEEVLPQDPNDPTSGTSLVMPSTEKPSDYKTNYTGTVRTDL